MSKASSRQRHELLYQRMLMLRGAVEAALKALDDDDVAEGRRILRAAYYGAKQPMSKEQATR